MCSLCASSRILDSGYQRSSTRRARMKRVRTSGFGWTWIPMGIETTRKRPPAATTSSRVATIKRSVICQASFQAVALGARNTLSSSPSSISTLGAAPACPPFDCSNTAFSFRISWKMRKLKPELDIDVGRGARVPAFRLLEHGLQLSHQLEDAQIEKDLSAVEARFEGQVIAIAQKTVVEDHVSASNVEKRPQLGRLQFL